MKRVFRKQLSTSAKNKIALQYATLKQDTSRYQEEMQTKFKYPAETTARSRENSPPDVSVYQTSSDNK